MAGCAGLDLLATVAEDLFLVEAEDATEGELPGRIGPTAPACAGHALAEHPVGADKPLFAQQAGDREQMRPTFLCATARGVEGKILQVHALAIAGEHIMRGARHIEPGLGHQLATGLGIQVVQHRA